MPLTKQAIINARNTIEGWGRTGDHYRAMDNFIAEVGRYFDAEETRRLRPIPAGVIRDSRTLGEAMAKAGIEGQVAEIMHDDTNAQSRYQITIGEEEGVEPLVMEGTVAQLTRLLGQMAH